MVGMVTEQRRLAVPGTFNLRDVGGYPVGEGGTVRWRTLLRSDALHLLDDDGRAALADVGLRTVVDLRTREERAHAPSALDGIGAATAHIPIASADALAGLPPDLSGIYRFFIDQRGSQVTAAVAALCRPGALPALVHCSAGKDRTGVVVALTLAAVGVEDEVIAADYALSARPVLVEPRAAAQVRESIGQRALVPDLMTAPPELMLSVLARVRRAGGSVAGYLAGHGLDRPDLERLRRALVEDGSAKI
jgi:protein-tyrosine phosphatase